MSDTADKGVAEEGMAEEGIADEGAAVRMGEAVLTNAVGLHARPAVKLTQAAKRFAGPVEFALDSGGPWIDAKSPVKTMRAKAPNGATLHFRTGGPDAAAALDAMLDLVRRRFDEV